MIIEKRKAYIAEIHNEKFPSPKNRPVIILDHQDTKVLAAQITHKKPHHDKFTEQLNVESNGKFRYVDYAKSHWIKQESLIEPYILNEEELFISKSLCYKILDQVTIKNQVNFNINEKKLIRFLKIFNRDYNETNIKKIAKIIKILKKNCPPNYRYRIKKIIKKIIGIEKYKILRNVINKKYRASMY